MTVIAIFANGILLVSTFMWAPTAALIASGVALVTGLPAYYFFDKKTEPQLTETNLQKILKAAARLYSSLFSKNRR